MRAFVNASVGAVLAALAAVPVQSQPVTAEQRQTAVQAQQQGVPLAELSASAPDSYTVRTGDTLWGIAGLFLRRPWHWPQLWGMNLASIANPHLIYPGQQLYLDKQGGYARLHAGQVTAQDIPTVRLSPRVRSESLAEMALPTLPVHLIEPFLARPMVVDAQLLRDAPRIVATTDERVLMANGDRAYVRASAGELLSAAADQPRSWRIFRDAVALKDPDNGEILGYEAQYLGQAELLEGEKAASDSETTPLPAVINIVDANSEIRAGDRLLRAPERSYANYVPHAPTADVKARVVSIYGNSAVKYAAQNQVIAINRGLRDGMAPGQVLELITQGQVIQDKTGAQRERVQLPREHNGLAMVFRSFDRVSYALILDVRRGVVVGDYLVTPD